MAELADAADSKSADRKVVGVRPPLPAPHKLFIIYNIVRLRNDLCGESMPKLTRLFTLRRRTFRHCDLLGNFADEVRSSASF